MVQPSLKQPVGVSGLPFVGNIPDFARDPIKFITRLKEEYGDVVAFSLMGNKSVLISNPKDVDRVLLDTGKQYSNGKSGDDSSTALKAIIGNGLVRSEGDFWKRQRKLMAPAFHHQGIQHYADVMVAFTQEMARGWQDGSIRNIHDDMMTLAQRIIMKAMFDVDVRDNADEASQAFNDMMHAIGAEMKGIEAVLPDFIPTPSRTQMKKGVAYINGLLTEIIEQRRAEGSDKRDLLTILMDARDDEGQPMTLEQLLDEIRTLYLAGHETTATTLSWAWLLLSQNPEAYAKVEREVAQVLNGRTATAEDVKQLVYCDAVIKESLRCYPVAWITRRIALEDVEIGGYQIAKGTSVFLSPWILHHDPRWFENPDAFMPERWLKDKAELPSREAYIPFGRGPRICIGNGFAMMESVLILATLLQQYHVSVLPEPPAQVEMVGTLRPRAGLQARITGRHRADTTMPSEATSFLQSPSL